MKVFDFIERNKFSVLGTLAFHVFIFVWSNWHVIETAVPQPEKERVVAVMDFSIDKPEKKEPEINPDDPNQIVPNENNAQMENVSANVSQEKTTYTNSNASNFSKAQAEKEVWEELKAMEAAEFNALQQGKTISDKTSKNQENNENEVSQNLVKENVEKNDKAGYGMDVVASVYFELKGRNLLSDKKPSYVCKNEGIVRVIIKVNQKGQVVSKAIDESKTNTQNECLRNAALEYAGLWKFNQNFNDEIRKQGWIEFRYKAQ